MTHPGGRTLITVLAMRNIASLIARNASAQALTGGRCIAFEDLPLHTEYHVGDTIATGLVEFDLRPFIDEDGNTVIDGFVRVDAVKSCWRIAWLSNNLHHEPGHAGSAKFRHLTWEQTVT